MAQSFNFTAPNDYDIQARTIERRRKMAEMLQQQAMTPLEPNRMAGGYVVPISPMEGIAKMAQAWAAGQSNRQADTDLRRLGEEMTADRADALRRAMEAGQGTPIIPQPSEELGGGPGRPAMPGNTKAMYEILAGAKDPGLQQVGLQGMAKALMPKEPIKLGKDDRLIDPATYRPLLEPTRQPKYHVVNGNLVAEPTDPGQQVTPAYSAPEKKPESIRAIEIAMTNAGIDPKSPQGQQLFRNLVNKQTTHQPASSQNVVVNTEKNLFGDMAGAVGKGIAGQTDQARAAVSTINTVSQIRDAISTGKVIAGPGTTARQFIGQVGQVLGVAGKDATEQLVETRKAIQGLAQLELDAAQQMKGQGQITEAERAIIRRAASGDIDGMSVPELNSLMAVMDKTARFKIQSNQRNVELLRGQPGAGPLPQFMDVPMPPAYQAPANIPPPPPGFQVQPNANRR